MLNCAVLCCHVTGVVLHMFMHKIVYSHLVPLSIQELLMVSVNPIYVYSYRRFMLWKSEISVGLLSYLATKRLYLVTHVPDQTLTMLYYFFYNSCLLDKKQVYSSPQYLYPKW